MSKTKDIDGGKAWSVLLASFLLSALVDGLSYSFGLIYVELLRVYEESHKDTIWIGSLQQSVGYIISLPLAYCIKQWGYRPVMLISSICTATSYLISTYLHDIKALYITLGFLNGMGLIGIELGYQIALQKFFVKKRLVANGITTSGTGFGVLIFGPICTFLLYTYGLPGCLLIMGAIAFNSIALTFLIPKTAPLDSTLDECRQTESENSKYNELLEDVSSDKVVQTNQKSYNSVLETSQDITSLEKNKTHKHNKYGFLKKEIWQNIKVMLYIVGSAPSHAYMKCVLVFLPDRVMKAFHLSKSEATTLLTLIGVTNFLARPFLGLMSHKSTERRKQILYASSALVSGTAIAISFASPTMVFQVIFVLIFGTASACLVTFEYPVICDIIRIEDLESVIGISHCFIGLVVLASLVLAGWSVDITGNYLVAFSCFGGLQIFASILLFLIVC